MFMISVPVKIPDIPLQLSCVYLALMVGRVRTLCPRYSMAPASWMPMMAVSAPIIALVRLCHHRNGDLVGLGAAGKKIYFSARTSAGFSYLVCGSS